MAVKFKISRTYNWLTKNPVIDKMRTVLQDEGLFHKRELVHQLSGVAVATLDGWFEGDTLSPQSRTVQMVMTGLGYEYNFVKVNESWDLERELTKAAKWNLQHSKSVSKDALAFAKQRLNGKSRARAITKPKQRAYHAAQRQKSERRVASR